MNKQIGGQPGESAKREKRTVTQEMLIICTTLKMLIICRCHCIGANQQSNSQEGNVLGAKENSTATADPLKAAIC